ncbi:MAG TPA: isochorismatase family protein [Bacteroidia bacterium]|jgi:nicotinamidase-related amidase|nr:isochorismatase family protein [Bacteroidia bacterium]
METTNTAFLVMDVQQAIGKMFTDTTILTNPLKEALAAARAHNIVVIYVVVGFRKDYPELTPARKALFQTMDLDKEEGYRVLDAVAPAEGEVVVTKRRVSAFSGSGSGSDPEGQRHTTYDPYRGCHQWGGIIHPEGSIR